MRAQAMRTLTILAALFLVAPVSVSIEASTTTGDPSLPPGEMAQLWVEPGDIASRDLFHGPGGSAQLPNTNDLFEFLKADTTGHSRGYDVKGPDGRKWKVKIGEESQAEIVVSRVL